MRGPLTGPVFFCAVSPQNPRTGSRQLLAYDTSQQHRAYRLSKRFQSSSRSSPDAPSSRCRPDVWFLFWRLFSMGRNIVFAPHPGIQCTSQRHHPSRAGNPIAFATQQQVNQVLADWYRCDIHRKIRQDRPAQVCVLRRSVWKPRRIHQAVLWCSRYYQTAPCPRV